MNEKPVCPKCKSTDVKRMVKSKENKGLSANHVLTGSHAYLPRGRSANEKAMTITLYTLGLSMRAIAKIFNL